MSMRWIALTLALLLSASCAKDVPAPQSSTAEQRAADRRDEFSRTLLRYRSALVQDRNGRQERLIILNRVLSTILKQEGKIGSYDDYLDYVEAHRDKPIALGFAWDDYMGKQVASWAVRGQATWADYGVPTKEALLAKYFTEIRGVWLLKSDHDAFIEPKFIAMLMDAGLTVEANHVAYGLKVYR